MKVSARGLKEPTAQRLDLIDQESEPHQAGKDGGQVLLAMTVMVLELIALVFERIETRLSSSYHLSVSHDLTDEGR